MIFQSIILPLLNSLFFQFLQIYANSRNRVLHRVYMQNAMCNTHEARDNVFWNSCIYSTEWCRNVERPGSFASNIWIWKTEAIMNMPKNSQKNTVVFGKISKKMEVLGFKRDAIQCRSESCFWPTCIFIALGRQLPTSVVLCRALWKWNNCTLLSMIKPLIVTWQLKLRHNCKKSMSTLCQ